MLQIGLTARRYDAVVSQNFTPLTGRGQFIRATFLHDALFRDRPQWFTLSERLYLGVASLTLPRARRVLTSSKAEADRIRRVFPRVRARVAAVGLSVPLDLDQPGGVPSLVAIERPFILAVGRLNVRKNIQRLIRVFSRGGLAERFDLIIVGAPDGKSEAVTDVAGVHFTGHVTDSELISLYSQCEFFVFPSLGEGFGLPLLEAARFGAPSAASDIPPFREINTAAVYFDPHDDKSMAEGLAEMASQHRRSANGSKGVPAVALSWADVAVAARSAMFD
ncbi:glycosyltransferase family 4 protein [Microbacterium oleivorans]|uniref:glycosyltransferase family 4 protein n=1 Tax=Microbacterium oleivorans TaxID=273677 RepID=UPI0020418CC2|nr:glycosyltransferase family 1 protein [Microbacterium oleivorans]MCM3697150.1 glycosyltransferase family 4 protein [Microbacterium oleivorans]